VRAARDNPAYVSLAQGAIDLAVNGVTSLAEAMAIGSGLEELVDADATLSDDGVDTLLAREE
jgi:hypothetical protein